MMMREQNIVYLAFSDRGFSLAQRLAEALGGKAFRSGQPLGVKEWTARYFNEADALVYAGAAGIAVRAIAPFIEDKTKDPAVVVIDERALHVIPVLSGHLGGANDLARRIAEVTGSSCAITTATDVNGIFAVDEWSKRQNCALLEKDKIVEISGALLAGKTVNVSSRWPVRGNPPEGIRLLPQDAPRDEADIILDWMTGEEAGIDAGGKAGIDAGEKAALHLVPRICALGIGCRKGISEEALEERFKAFLMETGVSEAAICRAATIDLKKDEPGLLAFARKHGWPLTVFSAGELAEAEGDFTASGFVSSVTGVDNVCERSAALLSKGELIARKFSGGGVTFALAAERYEPDWEWKHE